MLTTPWAFTYAQQFVQTAANFCMLKGIAEVDGNMISYPGHKINYSTNWTFDLMITLKKISEDN